MTWKKHFGKWRFICANFAGMRSAAIQLAARFPCCRKRDTFCIRLGTRLFLIQRPDSNFIVSYENHFRQIGNSRSLLLSANAHIWIQAQKRFTTARTVCARGEVVISLGIKIILRGFYGPTFTNPAFVESAPSSDQLVDPSTSLRLFAGSLLLTHFETNCRCRSAAQMKRRFFRATETEQQKQKQTNYRLSTVSTFLLHKKSKDVKLIAYGCIISSTRLLQLWLLYDNFLNFCICSSVFSYVLFQ
jgi:hypothetical protein